MIQFKQTPLHTATVYRCTEIIDLLIDEFKADKEAKDEVGFISNAILFCDHIIEWEYSITFSCENESSTKY